MTWLQVVQIVIPSAVTLAVAIIGGRAAFRQQKATREKPSWAEMAEKLQVNEVRMDAVNERLDAERESRRQLEDRVGVLESHERGWGRFYDDLTLRWPTHRSRATPPPAPGHYRRADIYQEGTA